MKIRMIHLNLLKKKRKEEKCLKNMKRKWKKLLKKDNKMQKIQKQK